jgi:hypothetical protein
MSVIMSKTVSENSVVYGLVQNAKVKEETERKVWRETNSPALNPTTLEVRPSIPVTSETGAWSTDNSLRSAVLIHQHNPSECINYDYRLHII